MQTNSTANNSLLPRKNFFVVVLLLATIPVFSQKSMPKTLLWRISGKGLQKPSYLFGTIHLRDKAVFNFGDSVYAAIEKTEGLALEVNPDEMMAWALNRTLEDGDKKLTDILSEKDVKQYGNALAKKLGKPINKISAHDILFAQNKLGNSFAKDNMETFVDAWLYGVAKGQGKWLGGIEDIADQSDILDNLVDRSAIESLIYDSSNKSLAYLNQLKKFYINEDVQKLGESTGTIDTSIYNMIFTNRNKKMALRIDSLAGVRPTFFAVGAGHLPGSFGVVELLIEKGYELTPVFSSKKTAASKYSYKTVPVEWVTVADPMYTVKMPGKPLDLKYYGLVDFKFLMDISKMVGFQTLAVYKGGDSANLYAGMDSVAARMFGTKYKKIQSKSEGDVTMAEYLAEKNEDLQVKLRFLSFDSKIYMILMFAADAKRFDSPEADMFFNSFHIKKDAGKETLAFHEFKDSITGVKLKATAPFVKRPPSVQNNESWNVDTYTSMDAARGLATTVVVKSVKKGLYISSDSILAENNKEALSQFFNAQQIRYLSDNDGATRYYDLKSSDYPDLATEAFSVVLGNKNILIQTMSDSLWYKKGVLDSVIKSIKYTNAGEVKNWTLQNSKDGVFSSWAPSAFENKKKSGDDYREDQFITYDTVSANTYFVTHSVPGKYFWAAGDSAFMQKQKEDWIVSTDSLIHHKKLVVNNLDGEEFLLTKKGSNVYRRVLFLKVPDGVFILSGYSKKETLFTPNVNRFFYDFRVNQSLPRFDFTKSKSSLLLEDLASKDSATRSNALEAFGDAPFTKSDVPVLNEALYKSYSFGDTGNDRYTINRRLVRQLIEMGDPSTVEYISKFGELNNLPDELKNLTLNLLSGIKTKDSYQLLGKLLGTLSLDESPYYDFRKNLGDSSLLTASVFEKIKPLLKDSITAPFAAAIAINLIDSGLVSLQTMTPFIATIEGHARNVLPQLKSSDDYDFDVDALFGLLAKLKSASSRALIDSFQFVRDPWLQEFAVKVLLKNGYPVDAGVLEALASNRELRYDLYTDLKKLGKLSEFPVKYLNQQMLGESIMLTDLDDAPKEVTFLKQKTYKINDKNYLFYLYKVSFDDDTKSAYLGIAGPFSMNTEILEPEEYYSGCFFDDSFSEDAIDEQFIKYMEVYQE